MRTNYSSTRSAYLPSTTIAANRPGHCLGPRISYAESNSSVSTAYETARETYSQLTERTQNQFATGDYSHSGSTVGSAGGIPTIGGGGLSPGSATFASE